MFKPRVKGYPLLPYVSVNIQNMPSLEPVQTGKGVESHHSHACPSTISQKGQDRTMLSMQALTAPKKHHPWITSRYINSQVHQLGPYLTVLLRFAPSRHKCTTGYQKDKWKSSIHHTSNSGR